MRDKHPVKMSLDVLKKSWRRHVHVKDVGERSVGRKGEKEHCLGLRKTAFVEDKKEETKVQF